MILAPVLVVAVNACGRLVRDGHRTMAVRMLVSFVLVDSGWTPELDAIIGRAAIGTPVRPPAYSVLCEGPVRAGQMAYLVADDRVSNIPGENAVPVYVDSVHHSSWDGTTATVSAPASLDFTKDSIGTTKTRAVDIHTIACDDAPREVDPRRWRAVVDTVFADCSEKSRTGDAYRRRHPIERDVAGDLATIAPVVAAYAVARFVWGYDVTSATADALARCEREDDPALTRYLVAYERA